MRAARQHLRLLFLLRNIALGGQVAAFVVAIVYLHMRLPYVPAMVVIGVMVGFNLWTRYRSRHATKIGEGELFLQLCMDAISLTVLLYLAGGATNPFTALYLLPITISTIILPARFTWLLVGLTVLCYSLLIPFNIPLPMNHDLHAANTEFNLHVLGMWLGFILSAGLVAFFVVRMGESLRRQESLINQQREESLRNERLLALGTQAATTAHELGTPLQTISLLIDELGESITDEAQTTEILATLKMQVERCKNALAELSAVAGNPAATSGGLMAVEEFLDEWQAGLQACNMRITPGVVCGKGPPACFLLVDRMLYQALNNLVDNAVRACAHHVAVAVEWDEGVLSIVIEDDGPGMNEAILRLSYTGPVDTGKGGMGIGLFLSRAVIERFGGRLAFRDRESGGTCVEVVLPVRQQNEETEDSRW